MEEYRSRLQRTGVIVIKRQEGMLKKTESSFRLRSNFLFERNACTRTLLPPRRWYYAAGFCRDQLAYLDYVTEDAGFMPSTAIIYLFRNGERKSSDKEEKHHGDNYITWAWLRLLTRLIMNR